MPNVRNGLAADTRPDIGSMDLAELERALESHGQARFHARQIFRWIYAKGESDFEKMTDLSKPLRADLRRALPRRHACRDHERRVVGRNGEVPSRPRRRPPDRIGVHPRHAEPDLLYFHAGRLRDEMRVLPDRQDGTGPQPYAWRDRRSGARPRAESWGCATRNSTSC